MNAIIEIEMKLLEKTYIALIFLLIILLWLLWSIFGAASPAWMGGTDGFILAKARFLVQGLGLGSWNRYWFLGIPGQHIGSPVLPFLLSIPLRIGLVGNLELFRLWRVMVALGVGGFVVSVYFFAKELLKGSFKHKKLEGNVSENLGAMLVGLIVLLLPSAMWMAFQIFNLGVDFRFPSWMVLSSFYLGDGYRMIGFFLVVVVMLLFWKLIENWNRQRAVLISFLIALVALVDSLSLLTMALWLVVFFFYLVVRAEKRKTSRLVLASRMVVVFIAGILLTSFWFTPGLILTFLGSPSLGGKAFFSVVLELTNKLLAFLPMIFALLVARKWLSKSSPPVVLGLMGILVFGSLTLAAFSADPDFWQDYSRFGRSLDLSLSILLGGIVVSSWQSKKRALLKYTLPFILVFFFSLPFLLKRERLFEGGFDIRETSEYRIGKVLEDFVKADCKQDTDCGYRAYLSGSSVYWLNSWFDIEQVRGGGNQGSLNDYWPHGSYQIREGRGVELASNWLEALGVSYLVVHDFSSSEVYRDFKFPSKFESMSGWEKIWEEEGDVVYFNSESTIARLTDLAIVKSPAPEKGDDLGALRSYVDKMEQPVVFNWIGSREIEISGDVGAGEGVRLAVAYSPYWQVSESSLPVEIRKDALGLMVIEPKDYGNLKVTVKFNPWFELISGFLITLIVIIALIRHPKFIELLSYRLIGIVGRETELDRSGY